MIKIILIALISTLASCKLYQSLILFRHGARYQDNDAYDGNQTKSYWGELTSVGMRQHFNLGGILRKQYIQSLGFLSQSFQKGQIAVYSTTFNRTVQSLISQLDGLYPLGMGPKMINVPSPYHLPPFDNKTDLNETKFALKEGYQPIRVNFDPKLMGQVCTNQPKQQTKNIQEKIYEYNEMNITYTPFFKKLCNIFNIPFDEFNFPKITQLSTNLIIDRYLGKPFPTVFTEEDYQNIQHLHSWYNYFIYRGDLAKAKIFWKASKIISDFDSRIQNVNAKIPKFIFLSGHDTDIFPFNNILNFSSSQCVEELYRKGSTDSLNCEPMPSFASSLLFQLHSEDERNFYVKVRSNGKYMNLCEQKSIECDYSEWKKRVLQSIGTEKQSIDICGNLREYTKNKEWQKNSFFQKLKEIQI